jgi:hypothetical protein
MANNKRKQPPPTKTTPQTTGLGLPRAEGIMRAIGNLIPVGGPIIGGDAETQRSRFQ